VYAKKTATGTRKGTVTVDHTEEAVSSFSMHGLYLAA